MDKDKSRAVPWIIFAAVLIIYLWFPTKQYFFDGVAFAQMIEDAPRLATSLIHPNHLVYNVIGYIFYKLLRGIGLDIRAITALQILSSICGAASAFVLFHTLRLSLRSLYLTSALTLLFAFTATWWKFSTDASAYVPSALFLLVSFYLIHPANKARPFLVALTFSVSMCLHQLAVIFYPVIVAGLFLQADRLTVKQRVLNIFSFSAAAFVVTFTAYYYCFYLATATLDFKRLVRWMTSYSPDASFSFNLLNNLGYTLRGHGRLFFGGRFNLIKGLINPLIALLMLALAASVLGLAFQLLRDFKRPGLGWLRALRNDPRRRPVALLCVLWAALYLCFLFVWLPHHTYYRLFYLPALILLAAMALAPYAERDARRPRRYRAALLVAAVALANFLFLIYPYAHAEKYLPLSFALEMQRDWPQPGTVIYYALENSDNSLFRYINPNTTWKQFDVSKTVELENELKEIYSRGGSAWLDASAIDRFQSTSEGAKWLQDHSRTQTKRDINNPLFNIKFVQLVP